MGPNLTKAPRKVALVASQGRGYLTSDIGGGLRFAPREPGSVFKLEAFSDASYSSVGGPSHGCLMIMLNGSAVFWRSGKQQLATLSTAECELVEFVNTITAGESIYVVLQELASKIRKVGWCDSRAALGTLENEGGNWRTRHLRFRSAYVRQLVQAGEWIACRIPGTNMIADLGTNALSSAKINQLKKILGMSNPPDQSLSGVSEVVEETETGASAPISEPQARDQAQAKRLVQLLSLIVTLQEAAGQDDDQADIPGRDEELKHWFPLVFYTILTILVIVLTLLGRYLCALVITLFVGEPLSNVPEENEASEDEKVEAGSSRDEVLERTCHLLEPLSGVPLRAPPEPKYLLDFKYLLDNKNPKLLSFFYILINQLLVRREGEGPKSVSQKLEHQSQRGFK